MADAEDLKSILSTPQQLAPKQPDTKSPVFMRVP